MSRRRPSGRGSNSRRFAEIEAPDGQTLKVPAVKDVGTFLFLSDDGETWPARPNTKLLDSAQDLQEGAYFEIEELGAGAGMGTVTGAKVVKVVVRVGMDSTGRYSHFAQLKRLVYAVRTLAHHELANLGPSSEGEPS